MTGALGPDDPAVRALVRIRAAVEEAERRSRTDAGRDAARTAELAERARRGELGPQWRAVQARVDRGETTLADVFTGRDTAPESVALARRSQEQIGDLVAAARQDDDVVEADEDLAAVRARVLGATGSRPSGTGPDDGTEPPLPPSVAWDPGS